ncbi:MAG: hypothetical protein M3N17_00515 [Actinomycetota bacterium]|nr:hypothetical protein [Actinomycetota bacterium]
MDTPGRAPAARSWPYLGRGQRQLLVASALVMFGSFLPWLDTAFGTFIGLRGGGLWTFYAGALGLAGTVLRHRRVVRVHALVTGLVALALPLWQVARLLVLGLTGGWAPGIGLVMVAGGGVLALRAAGYLRAA